MAESTHFELESLQERGILRAVDVQFARLLGDETGDTRTIVLLAAALASRAPAYGHVCVNLDKLSGTIRHEPDPKGEDTLEWPTGAQFQRALSRSPAVTTGRNYSKPLVLSGMRLFLSRYWLFQQELLHDLKKRQTLTFDVDVKHTRRDLGLLFPECLPRDATKAQEQQDLLDTIELEPTRQLLAALAALRNGLTIICGGPGTGKTTTVVRILAMLLATRQPAEDRPALDILLLAPTGKAASRLGQSISRAKAKGSWLPPGTMDLVPETAMTVHRALGLGGHQGKPRHTRNNPLDADVVVVDEASMVDLSLMTKIFAAVRPEARLILLGDPDQLASVEAGAVLADLVADRDKQSKEMADYFKGILGESPPPPGSPQEAAGLYDCIVELNRSHRFDEKSGIGSLAKMVNQGDSKQACSLLMKGDLTDIRYIRTRSVTESQKFLKEEVAKRLASNQSTAEASEALRTLQELRVLTAHRRGPLGAQRLNRTITGWVHSLNGSQADNDWYPGRPVLITRNDALLELYNGDTGVTHTSTAGELSVLFEGSTDTDIRAFHPARLPPHETVYAMTVHKSQGSEFEEVVLVLPDVPSPILTRELLYTAITRAKTRVTIIGNIDVFRAGVDEEIERSSGFTTE